MEMRFNETKDTYRTADFPAICTLYYLGFEPSSFERDTKSPSRVIVIFRRTKKFDAALQSLWNKQLTVEPLSFLETTRTIKARLRDSIIEN
jgi:hypothetical protein